MSKHNNSLGYSASRRCKCGRYMTLGEEKAGIGVFNYECPDCVHRRLSKPLTRDDYYEQFDRVFK
jgi:DNA-directed RNA polymerase subunit RPC12/RpoP